MAYFYSPSTKGFYHPEINGDKIPSDSVEITDDEHKNLLSGNRQGKLISSNSEGTPVLIDVSNISTNTPALLPPTPEELMAQLNAIQAQIAALQGTK